MRKTVKIISEVEKRFCDICGKELERPAVEISSLVIDRITTQDICHSGGYADIECKGFVKYSKKDICWRCTSEAINKALVDLYKKGE